MVYHDAMTVNAEDVLERLSIRFHLSFLHSSSSSRVLPRRTTVRDVSCTSYPVTVTTVLVPDKGVNPSPSQQGYREPMASYRGLDS